MNWQKMSTRQHDFARSLSRQYNVSVSQAAKYLDTFADHHRGLITDDELSTTTGWTNPAPIAPVIALPLQTRPTLTTNQVATLTGRSATTIRRWCRAGKLTAVKTSGRWVIDEAQLTPKNLIALHAA